MSSATQLCLSSLPSIPSPLSRLRLLQFQLQNLPRPQYSSAFHSLLSLQSDRRPAIRWTSPITMSGIHLTGQLELSELRDESEFEKLLSPSGLISICGFGSLLSERSARSTFPNLKNFRVARLNGFRRVYAHAAPIFFERGIAKPETKEISSLSVEPCEGESLIVTVFEIQQSEIPAFIERELEFRFLAVLPRTLDGKPLNNLAVLCARYSDEEFFHVRCKGSNLSQH
ncbi:hypothetical protein SAY86_011155 [Trapa natans]|uniref:Uncharacterized protein n=1 Tax=Trapa natans TaxID=22666 RepID=A0AAN7R2I4_TRANT|nr:hypothetical protein SAY86_011155 [Trapa natans]